MAKLEKGDRVQFVGDPTSGKKAKGTVMQASHMAHGVQNYEIHTDLGTVLHMPEVDHQGNTILEKIGKAKDKDE